MRWIPALLLLAPAVAAAQGQRASKKTAAPLATARADVDGDGKDDAIRVDASGELTVELGGKRGPGREDSKFLAGSGTLAGAELSVGGGKARYVVATARWKTGDRTTQEALVVRWTKGKLEEVWRGEVGPVGRDAEYEVRVEATPGGLVRYQRRPGVERCDGAPARLFAEAWDGKAFRAARAEVAVDANAKVLTASRTAPRTAPTASAVYRAAAASTETGATDAGQLGAPRELGDGDPATVWRENVAGDGRGEFVTYRGRRGARLKALRIVPGDARSARHMARSGRVARFAVVTASGAFWVDVPDARPKSDAEAADAWWVVLDEAVPAECVSIVWSTFHAGKDAGVSAVSDLVVLADEDMVPGGADLALVESVIAGGITGDSAAKQLARRGALAARAIEARLAGPALPGDAQLRLWRVLARIADPGSAAELGRGLGAAGVAAEDAALIAGALARLGEPGQDQLARVAADGALPVDARIAAVDRLADDRREAMVAALGPGPRGLRKVVAVRLAAAGVAWLVEAAAQAEADGTSEREADLWRAVGLAAEKAHDAGRAQAIAALAGRGAEVTDYERRYRILAALAILPDAAATDAVRTITGALGEGTEAAALRQVAAAGLARSTSPGAAALLADLARDGDPGVRLAALHGLAGRDDLQRDGGQVAGSGRDAIDRVLQSALARDRWPEVRRTAAAALALACPRPGPTAALEDALLRDTDAAVRGDALVALVTCRAPGIVDRLFTIARSDREDLDLRERAVALIGSLEDPAQIAPLVSALGRWRSAAFSEQSGLVLAQRAAVTLGRLGAAAHDKRDAKAAKAARDALLDTASDPAFPEIQAAGAAGLGGLGAACDREARKLLQELARSDQAQVKIAATRALGSCGR